MSLTKEELDFLDEVSHSNAQADFTSWVEHMEQDYGHMDSLPF